MLGIIRVSFAYSGSTDRSTAFVISDQTYGNTKQIPAFLFFYVFKRFKFSDGDGIPVFESAVTALSTCGKDFHYFSAPLLLKWLGRY